ncbi:MAG: tryptophan synthase subunit alpha [Gammaproteobacteria bacterium]|nr:tryptophan synthase subunit alpha [Gammaproteobacteria bacterium]
MNRFITQLSQPNRMGVIPFFMLGDPTPEISLQLIKAAIEQGVDALELGFPFSDPMADGPVIQRSAERALRSGCDFATCVELLQKIRRFADLPIGLLIYYNLLLRQGIETTHSQLAAVGIDAILAVDLPLEEAAEHELSLQKHGIGNISLIAPNSDSERAKLLLDHASAFAYVVSSYGITGVRKTLPEDLPQRLAMLKKLNPAMPLVVGFGISEASQIKMLREAGADAVIVGSAITRLIEEHLGHPEHQIQAITQFLNDLKD